MNCKNCNTTLTPDATFCYCCGAKVIKSKLTLKNLIIHISETFLNYDNKFLQTTINLVKNPKDVIDGYINGTRKKYIEPLGFFAISVTISGVYLFIIRNYFPDIFSFQELYNDENTQRLQQKITESIFEYNAILNFIFIPIVAAMSKLVFWKGRYNFTEHLVIYFYTLSLFSIVSVVFTLIVLSISTENMMTFSGILYLGFFIYMCYVLTKIFNLNFQQLIFKILIFLPIFFVAYIILSILMLVILFATGAVSLQDFEPPS